MKRLLDLWSNKSQLESVAVLALSVFVPIMLQKPSKKSKNHDHIKYLSKHLGLWLKGDFSPIVSECEAIQSRLTQSKRTPEHIDKVFSRLMLQGKVSSALRWVTNNSSKPLALTDDVVASLKNKHPDGSPPSTNHLIIGPIPFVEPVIFDNIDGDLIYKVSKQVKGSHGPSGASSDTLKQVLCSKAL